MFCHPLCMTFASDKSLLSNIASPPLNSMSHVVTAMAGMMG